MSASLETILTFGSLTLDEVTQVRLMLEVPAARLAAENRTEQQAAEFAELLARQDEIERSLESVRDAELFDIGQAVYSLIGTAGGNRKQFSRS